MWTHDWHLFDDLLQACTAFATRLLLLFLCWSRQSSVFPFALSFNPLLPVPINPHLPSCFKSLFSMKLTIISQYLDVLAPIPSPTLLHSFYVINNNCKNSITLALPSIVLLSSFHRPTHHLRPENISLRWHFHQKRLIFSPLPLFIQCSSKSCCHTVQS